MQRHVLMVGRIYEEEEVFKFIILAAATLIKHGPTHLFFMDKKTMNKIKTQHPEYECVEFTAENHANNIDYVVTIGGDGTILYAAKEFVSDPPYFVTFQRGTLGFLCRFKASQIEDVIDNLCKLRHASFKEERIMRLEAVTEELIKSCVNEVHISKKKHERVILEVYVNGLFLTETACDGLLISTPTGSTAYSLSAGGPIIQNGVNSLLLVPVAPNSLAFRPICLKGDTEIRVTVSKASRTTALLTFDGQTSHQLLIGQSVFVKKSKYDFKFLQPKQEQQKIQQWMQRLTLFLGWNQKYTVPFCDYQPKIPLKKTDIKESISINHELENTNNKV